MIGFTRLRATAEPSVPTWCGDAALAELRHVRLGACTLGAVLAEGSGHEFWVALHRPTAPSPSVLVLVRGVEPTELERVVSERLARGELDIVRTERDGSVGRFRGFPDVATAVFVGEARDAVDAAIDTTTAVYLGLGGLFIAADGLRLVRWLSRRIRGA